MRFAALGFQFMASPKRPGARRRVPRAPTSDDLKHRLGRSIARERLAQGLEQEDLARQATATGLGGTINRGQISRWENGDNLVRFDALLAIASVLKKSVDELAIGKESFFDEVVAELDGRFGARIARIEKHLGI